MKLTLTRLESSDQGTFGKLLRWHTLELPWRDNNPRVSCIPEGVYPVAWAFSPAFRRNTYRLAKTGARTGILIHSANLAGDESMGFKTQLRGCIALGERIGWMDGQKCLLLSRPAVRALEDMLGREPFTLEVV